MAKDKLKNQDLIVNFPANGKVVKDGKITGYFADVQRVQDAGFTFLNKKGQVRSNPHVFSETVDKGNGQSMINHRAFIGIDTVNKIMKAANKAGNVQYKTRDYDSNLKTYLPGIHDKTAVRTLSQTLAPDDFAKTFGGVSVGITADLKQKPGRSNSQLEIDPRGKINSDPDMDGRHGTYFMEHQDELTDMAKARVMSHMSKSVQTKAFNNLAHKLNNMFPMRDGTNNDRTFKFVGVKITRNEPDENHPDGSYNVDINKQGPTVKPGQDHLVPDSYIYGPGKELPLNFDHADMKAVLGELDYAYHAGILPIDAQEADRIFTPAMGKDFKTLPNYDSREAVQEQLGKTLKELLHTGQAGKKDVENLTPIVGGDWRGREDAPFDLNDYDQVDSEYPWEYTDAFDTPEINLSFYKPDGQHVGTHEDYDAQTMNDALAKTKSFVHANPNLFEGSAEQLEANLGDRIKSNDRMVKLFDFQAHPFEIDQDVADPETKINNLGNDLVKSNQAEDDLDK